MPRSASASKRCSGIVSARDRHQSHPRSPKTGGQRRVKDGAARFAHQRCSVVQDDVVDQQVAQKHQVGAGARHQAVPLGKRGKRFRHRLHALRIDRICPVAVALHRGTDDEAVGVRILADVGRRHARADERGNAHGRRHGLHFVWLRLAAGRRAGDDHAVGQRKLRGMRRVGQTHVGGDGMRGVFLLHVGKHLHVAGADLLAIPQQHAGVAFDDALIGHMRKHIALDPHETGAARQRHGERLAIRAASTCTPSGSGTALPHLAPDHRHRRHRFRADRALQIRAVVHVLDHQSRESRRRGRPSPPQSRGR